VDKLISKTSDISVIQVGYVANVPYFLCYGLETLGIRCYNVIPRSILESKYAKIFYGSIYNGNPLKIKLLIIDDNTHIDFIKSLLKILYKMREKYRNVIIHLHIGSALKDHIILKLVGKILNFRLFIHMHGTDLRNLSYIKAEVLKILYQHRPWFVSTPDLLMYCRHLNIECIWLHNPIDPVIISELRSREKPWNTDIIRMFIPTRFDETKGLSTFYELLIDALREDPKLPDKLLIYIIVWPNTMTTMNYYIQQLREREVKIKLLPLLSRREMLEMYYKSNIVVGQFIYGTMSLTELEALSLQNYVIMRPLNAITRYAYKTHFGMQKIPISEIQNSNELATLLSSIPQRPNKEGLSFTERVANTFKISRDLVKYYQNLD